MIVRNCSRAGQSVEIEERTYFLTPFGTLLAFLGRWLGRFTPLTFLGKNLERRYHGAILENTHDIRWSRAADTEGHSLDLRAYRASILMHGFERRLGRFVHGC